jgi:hypothetical protein
MRTLRHKRTITEGSEHASKTVLIELAKRGMRTEKVSGLFNRIGD